MGIEEPIDIPQFLSPENGNKLKEEKNSLIGRLLRDQAFQGISPSKIEHAIKLGLNKRTPKMYGYFKKTLGLDDVSDEYIHNELAVLFDAPPMQKKDDEELGMVKRAKANRENLRQAVPGLRSIETAKPQDDSRNGSATAKLIQGEKSPPVFIHKKSESKPLLARGSAKTGMGIQSQEETRTPLLFAEEQEITAKRSDVPFIKQKFTPEEKKLLAKQVPAKQPRSLKEGYEGVVSAEEMDKLNKGITTAIKERVVDPVVEGAKMVAENLPTALRRELHGTPEGRRAVAKTLIGGGQAVMGVIPQMAALGMVAPEVSKVTGEIGEKIAGAKGREYGEKLGHVVAAIPLGKKFILGTAASLAGEEGVSNLLNTDIFKDTKEEDKGLITNLASQGAFFAAIGLSPKIGKKLKGIKDYVKRKKIIEQVAKESGIEPAKVEESLKKTGVISGGIVIGEKSKPSGRLVDPLGRKLATTEEMRAVAPLSEAERGLYIPEGVIVPESKVSAKRESVQPAGEKSLPQPKKSILEQEKEYEQMGIGTETNKVRWKGMDGEIVEMNGKKWVALDDGQLRELTPKMREEISAREAAPPEAQPARSSAQEEIKTSEEITKARTKEEQKAYNLTQAEIMQKAGIPEEKIPDYMLDSEFDSKILGKRAKAVLSKEMTIEEAAEAVKKDYEKMVAGQKEAPNLNPEGVENVEGEGQKRTPIVSEGTQGIGPDVAAEYYRRYAAKETPVAIKKELGINDAEFAELLKYDDLKQWEMDRPTPEPGTVKLPEAAPQKSNMEKESHELTYDEYLQKQKQEFGEDWTPEYEREASKEYRVAIQTAVEAGEKIPDRVGKQVIVSDIVPQEAVPQPEIPNASKPLIRKDYTKGADQGILDFLVEKGDEANQRMLRRMNEARSTFILDPRDVVDLAIVGAGHLARGVKNFEVFSKALAEKYPKLSNLGEEQWKKIYDESWAQVRKATESLKYNPNQAIRTGEPIQKEGYAENVRLERFPKEVAERIEHAAEEMQPLSRDIRRPIKWEETGRLAGELAKTDYMERVKRGEMLERRSFLREELHLLGEELIRNKPNGKKISAEYANIIKTYIMGAHESGGALNILRRNFPESVAALIEAGGGKAKVKVEPGFLDAVLEVARNAKLMSLSGLVRSGFGDTFSFAMKAPESWLSGAINAGLSKVTGKEQTRFTGDAFEFATNAFPAKKKAMQNAVDTFLGRDEKIQADRWLSQEDYAHTNVIGTKKGSSEFTRKAGVVIRTPQRAQGSVDAFYRTMIAEGLLHEYSSRRAKIEANRAELKGAEANEYILKRKSELLQDRAMIERAKEEAKYYTYQNEGGQGIKSINRFRKTTFGKITTGLNVPFLNTGANLFKYAVERTPLVALTPSFYQAFAEAFGKGGKQQRKFFEKWTGNEWESGIGRLTDKLSRATLGTAFTLASSYIALEALEGAITGAAPKDPTKRALWLKNNQENSIRVPGVGWVSYRGFEPASSFFSLIADMANGKNEEGMIDRSLDIVRNFARSFAENPFLAGTKDAIEVLTGDDPNDDTKDDTKVGKFISGLAVGAVVPNIIAQTKWVVDPTVRESVGLGQSFLNKLPFASKGLPYKIGPDGQPINVNNPAGRWFGFLTSPEKNDVVASELQRLGVGIGKPSKGSGMLEKYGRASGEFTPEEFRILHEVVNENSWNAVKAFIMSEAYKQITDRGDKTADEIRASEIRNIREKIAEVVKKTLALMFEGYKAQPTPEQSQKIKEQMPAFIGQKLPGAMYR